jgi:hypothetical protein
MAPFSLARGKKEVSTEERRVEVEKRRVYLHALTAGAYTTALLVMVRVSPSLLMCPSKIFRHGIKII